MKAKLNFTDGKGRRVKKGDKIPDFQYSEKQTVTYLNMGYLTVAEDDKPKDAKKASASTDKE